LGNEANQQTGRSGKKVLMTTPSLDPRVNVSGISSVVRGLIYASRHPGIAFEWTIDPLIAGKRDVQRRGFGWLMSQTSVLSGFYRAIRQSQPEIVHINGPLSKLAILRDAVLIRVARSFRLPIVYHLHGGTYIHDAPPSNPIRRLAVASLNSASVILVLSDLEAESIAKVYDINPDRIRVLRNAVEVPETCSVRATMGCLRVLSIGRLSPEKGLSVLCDAIEADPDLSDQLELRMHGAGDLEAEITSRLAAALGSAFSFQGIAGDEEKSRAYAWADVVAIPSLWGEGLPMVLLEAMAAGATPVATPDGSISEVLKDQWNSILVEKGSSESLAKGLLQALEMKRTGALQELAANAHRTVQDTYSLSAQGQILSQIYKEITQ
jgi:glycosyltransferase involved in cell wall biosynthesis